MGRTKKQPAESAPKAKVKAKAKASSAQISPLLDAENNAMLASSGTLVENQFPNNFVDWLHQVWLSFINKADCGSGRDFYLNDLFNLLTATSPRKQVQPRDDPLLPWCPQGPDGEHLARHSRWGCFASGDGSKPSYFAANCGCGWFSCRIELNRNLIGSCFFNDETFPSTVIQWEIVQAPFDVAAFKSALLDDGGESHPQRSYCCSQSLFKCDLLFNPDPSVTRLV